MTLGQKIKELRLRKHLTQSDLVGDFMTRNMLSKIENGSATPSIKTLEFLAKTLGVPVASIMNDVDEASDCKGANVRQLDLACGQIDALFKEADTPGGMKAEQIKYLAVTAKARVYMARGDVEEARELLTALDMGEFSRERQSDIYLILEECCAMLDDYKTAYEYAIKRMAGE